MWLLTMWIRHPHLCDNIVRQTINKLSPLTMFVVPVNHVCQCFVSHVKFQDDGYPVASYADILLARHALAGGEIT